MGGAGDAAAILETMFVRQVQHLNNAAAANRRELGLQITVTKRPINALIKTALILVITL
jgi:hypothetical protein